jgi:hypothetical protein
MTIQEAIKAYDGRNPIRTAVDANGYYTHIRHDTAVIGGWVHQRYVQWSDYPVTTTLPHTEALIDEVGRREGLGGWRV